MVSFTRGGILTEETNPKAENTPSFPGWHKNALLLPLQKSTTHSEKCFMCHLATAACSHSLLYPAVPKQAIAVSSRFAPLKAWHPYDLCRKAALLYSNLESALESKLWDTSDRRFRGHRPALGFLRKLFGGSSLRKWLFSKSSSRTSGRGGFPGVDGPQWGPERELV